MNDSLIGVLGRDDVPEMVSAAVRVLLADDHPVLIAGIRRVLEGNENIEIVGEAHSGPEVLALIERRRPQLVLLDLRMPGVNGTDCIERIRQRWPQVKTVVLSACADQASINGALHAGASAYVIKSVSQSDIAALICQTARGTVFRSAPVLGTVGVAIDRENQDPPLTEREHEILKAVASGLTTAAISKDLWVSEHTVKFHLTNIYRKLGVANRAGAVRYAVDRGLVAA
jgi:DNA-binding NarL/FixJ family response regulator